MNKMLMEDARKLNKAWMAAWADAGVVPVRVTVFAQDMAEMKTKMKEHGYNYVVGNYAWRKVNDIRKGNEDKAVKIRKAGNGYVATVTDYRKI